MRFLLLTLLLAGQVSAQGLPVPTLEWPEGEKPVEIPFRYDTGLVVIEVSVEGSEELDFILDTGAPVMVISDPAVAEALELEVAMQVPVGGVGDEEPVMAPLCLGVGAKVGPLSIGNESLVYGVGQNIMYGYDGVIGASIFRNCVVEYDWDEKKLRLHDPESFEYAGDGESFDVTVAANGHPYVAGFSAQLGDGSWTELTLHLDSGYAGAFTLYLGSHDRIVLPQGAVETIIAWGSRGPARGHLGRVPGLRAGESELHDIPTNFQEDSATATRGSLEHQGAVGLLVLDRFHTFIDFTGGRLILEPSERIDESFAANTTGVRVAPWKPGSSEVPIADVIPGSPAAESGIETGDSITRINDQDVAEMSYEEISNAWEPEPGTKVELTILRDGEAMKRSLVSKRFL